MNKIIETIRPYITITNIVFTLIVLIITAIAVYLLYVYFVNYYKSYKNNAFHRLINSKIKHYKTTSSSVSLLVSNNYSLSSDFLKNIYSEYNYNYEVVENSDCSSNIKQIYISSFGNSILVCPIVEDHETHKCHILSELISGMMFEDDTNQILTGILILDDFKKDGNKLDELSEIVNSIIQEIKLNLPIYYLSNSISSIPKMDKLMGIIDTRFYLNMIGYTPNEYTHEDIVDSDVNSNIINVSHNMKSLLYGALNTDDSSYLIDHISDMLNIPEQFVSYASQAYIRFKLLKKKITSQYRPVIRGMFFTYNIEINKHDKYIFVSDLIRSRMPAEYNIVNIGSNVVLSRRSKAIEIFMSVVCIFLTFYTGFCTRDYIVSGETGSNDITDMMRLKNIAKSSGGNVDVATISKMLNISNRLIEHKYSSINYIGGISNIVNSGNKYKKSLIVKQMNYIYSICYSRIIAGINDKVYGLNISNNINAKNLNNISQDMIISNKHYKSLVLLHNSYHEHKDKYLYVMRLICKLYNVDERSLSNYKNLSQYCNLYKFREINQDNELKLSFIQNIINTVIKELDSQHISKKLDLYKQQIDNAITSLPVVNKSIINIINNLIENPINFDHYISYFNYIDVQKFLNDLIEGEYINVITNDIYNLIQAHTIRNIEYIKSISNKYIGNIYVVDQSDSLNIDLSKSSSHLINICNQVYESSLYKKVHLDNAYDKRLWISNSKIAIPNNIGEMISFIAEYKRICDNMSGDDFISIEFKKMINNLLEIRLVNYINNNSIYIDVKHINKKTIGDIYRCITQEIDNQEQLIKELLSLNLINIDKYVDQLYSSYIKVFFNYLSSANCFYEQSVSKVKGDVSKPVIKNIYIADDINDLQERFKSRVEIFSNIMEKVDPILNLISIKPASVVASEKQKYYYILDTMSIINSYETSTGKLYLLSREIMKLFNIDKYDPVPISKAILSGDDYIKIVYQKYLDSIKVHQDYVRNKVIRDIAGEIFMYQNIIANTSPIIKIKGKNTMCYETISMCIKLISDLYESLEKIKKTGTNSIMFNTLYEVCKNIKQIKNDIESSIMLSMDIKVNEELAKYFKNIEIECGGHNYNYDINSGIKYIKIKLQDQIVIKTGPLSSAKYKFVTHNDSKVNADINGVEIRYDNIGLLSFQQEAINYGGDSLNHLTDSFSIPIKIVEVNYNSGDVEEFHKSCRITIKIDKPNLFNESIIKMNDIIEKIKSIIKS